VICVRQLSIESGNTDALSYLMGLGLTRLQAKAYLCLASLGRAKASRLAKELGMVRPEVYRVLSELMRKGLVIKLLGSPAKYEVSDPEHGLHMLLDNLSRKAQELVAHYGEVCSFIENSATSNGPPETEFRLLPGRDGVTEFSVAMLGRARVFFDVVYSKWGLARMTRSSLGRRALVAAHRRGVRTRIISQIDKSNCKQASALAEYAEIRHTDDLIFYMNLCDGKEVSFGPQLIDRDLVSSREQVDLWTNNSAFVNALQGMFDNLWERSAAYRFERDIVMTV